MRMNPPRKEEPRSVMSSRGKGVVIWWVGL